MSQKLNSQLKERILEEDIKGLEEYVAWIQLLRYRKSSSNLLYYALLQWKSKVIEWLLALGYNPNLPHKNCGNALHMAVKQDLYALIPRLVEAGAYIDYVNRAGYTALHLAVSHHKVYCVKKLLLCGANPNFHSLKATTPYE